MEARHFSGVSVHTGNKEPEKFYHGFVLGLIVELQREYIITSNRESGFGRYDVMLEPKIRKVEMRLFWSLRYTIRKTRKR